MKLVMKFGGSSLADGQRIRAAAGIVAQSIKDGNKVAVVVSAMGSVTDQLIEIGELIFGKEKILTDAVRALVDKHRCEVEKVSLIPELGVKHSKNS